MKDGSYVINIDENKSLGIHWVNLYHNGNAETGVESSGNEFIHNKIRKFNGNKNITTNIYRTHAYDSIVCRYVSIGFIDFMLKSKCFLE